MLANGSDGENIITNSFDACFSRAKHLLCDLHMKDNIKHTLSKLDIGPNEPKNYMEDIFCVQIGQVKGVGLVGSIREASLDLIFGP